jgi:hypothetical protein
VVVLEDHIYIVLVVVELRVGPAMVEMGVVMGVVVMGVVVGELEVPLEGPLVLLSCNRVAEVEEESHLTHLQ